MLKTKYDNKNWVNPSFFIVEVCFIILCRNQRKNKKFYETSFNLYESYKIIDLVNQIDQINDDKSLMILLTLEDTTRVTPLRDSSCG